MMARSALKHLALAGMVGAGAVSGVKEAKAETVPWSSYTDIVPTTVPRGSSIGQPIPSIAYSSSSSVSAPNNFSAIYFLFYNGTHNPIGGFDVRNGVITSASFNGFGNWYGLDYGETANSAEGSNPQNRFEGYWEVFYDTRRLDGSTGSDGFFGRIEVDENGNFMYFVSSGEQLSNNEYEISNFTPFDINTPGTFTFTANIPSTLTPLGLSTEALSDGTNVVRFQIAVTNLASFRLECSDSLTNAAWASLGTFAATGAVTEVSDTNTVPSRFYRVVRP
jgi:hypothetical protein